VALKKKQKQKKGAPLWMVSWSDMTTLLLTFFIVMMSFAEIDGEDFYLVLSSFRGSLGMMEGGYSLSSGKLVEMGQNMKNLPSTTQGRALSLKLQRAVSVFKPEIETKKVRVTEDERGLVITLASDSFFDPGSAALKNEMKPVLAKVGNVLREIPNFTRIEGHTDSNPISAPGATRGFSTNWELSGARGINVLRYLQEEEKINPKQLSAVAFAEQRPLDTNNTPEGRAYNRRVDIVILRDRAFTQGSDARIERPLPDEEWR